jgi:hypothetical protein
MHSPLGFNIWKYSKIKLLRVGILETHVIILLTEISLTCMDTIRSGTEIKGDRLILEVIWKEFD